jgi:hypothetical protein
MPERTSRDNAILDNENEAVIEEIGSQVPRQPNPPARHAQDTQPVDGDEVTDLPEGRRMSQRPEIQG